MTITRSVLLLPALLLGSACGATRTDAAPASMSHWALLDGQRIHYLDTGGDADEALVLVHGWAGSTVSWQHQFPSLGERARVLNVDLIGHGRSELPRGDITMALMADSIAAAMDDAGVERAVLVGHSNGVPVAQAFLARHPERTLALVGIDGTLRMLFDRDTYLGFMAPFFGSGWRDVMTGSVNGMPAPDMDPADRAIVLEMALATRHRAVVEAAEATLDPSAWSEDPITVPLLLVLAEQPTWDAGYEAWVRARAPQVDYRVWSGVGHYVQMERPAAFRAALLEFLSDNDLLR